MTPRPLLRPALRTAGGSGATATPAAAVAGVLRRAPLPEHLGLLAVAAVLNLWALDRNGTANDYYAAAVRSMTGSWRAFLCNSFDPARVMTVDNYRSPSGCRRRRRSCSASTRGPSWDRRR